MQNTCVNHNRRDYGLNELTESDIDPNPIGQFEVWLSVALEAPEIDEASAMTLATVGPDGKPSARVVLLRALDERGLVFFTNYSSRKGNELSTNENVAVVFYWGHLERQVRIEGRCSPVDDVESDEYFASRPFKSRIAAMASQQSEVIAGREVLDVAMKELLQRYSDTDIIPRPANWGGYRIAPTCFEFWQGRSARMHDRIRYELNSEGEWRTERLSP